MADPRQSGFTLVELLVSLAIFGFVMALSFDALRFSGAAWDSVSSSAATIDEESTTVRFLRTRLESISQPVHVQANNGDSVQWWLKGDASEFSFVAPWYRGAVPSGLYKFRIWLERRSGTGALLVAWEPYLPGATKDFKDEFSGERVLLQGVSAIRIRYFGAEQSGGPSDWVQRWDTTSTAPALVEFEITSERTGQKWLRLAVATGH